MSSGLFQLTSTAAYVAVRYDFGNGTTDPIYIGYSVPGTPEASASWTIKKVTLDGSGNPSKEEWTDQWTAVWNDRASETYF